MSDQTPVERWRDLFAMIDRAQANIPGASGQALVSVRFIAEDLQSTLTARCEALEQEKADFHMAYRLKCDEETKALHVRCEALTAERDTLRQKLSDADEIRVSFAAGYTAALDDALKGKP